MLNLDTLKTGDELPSQDIAITTGLIVAGAIASRDYENVHHDKDAAQRLGSPDIFMNILTTNGLVGNYVTRWAGPAARLKKVTIKLGVPNYPGDNMTMTGAVTAVDSEQQLCIIDVRGKNSLGYHVTGTVTLALGEQS